MSMIDRIAAAIETISDGFALLDAEHRFVLINSKFRQIFGVPDEVLRVGVHYADFIRAVGVSEAVADVDAFVADRMARLAASGEPFTRAPWRIRLVISGRFTPRQRGGILQADALDERVGMPMRELPFGPFAKIDQSDPQRPFLHRQTAGLDMAAFDDHKNHHVGRTV